jgi:hypothetical protein
MPKIENKIIGYFAVHSSQEILCDGYKCIIAGSQSALHKYIKSSHGTGSEYQIRKTRLGEILEGISLGGAYAFDKESYSVFYPLANQHGFNLKNEAFPLTESGKHFVVVKIIT